MVSEMMSAEETMTNIRYMYVYMYDALELLVG